MKPIIAIVGPTGVGKTKLSIEIAKRYGGEVISTDSMQFYKGLDIGTAKVSAAEKRGVKHHLIDILEPEVEFSVAEYQKIVRDKITELRDKDILPILVGGSGLYIQSVLYDYKFLGEKRETENLKNLKQYETDELYELLLERSPKLAKTVDPKNRRRILRALEKSDEEVDDSGSELFYLDAIIIGLNMEREKLYERIDARVDNMIENGLVAEAKKLFDKNISTPATKAIGYKELFPYFKGDVSLESAVELIKRNSRHYAKRQLTWFTNKMDVFWFEADGNNFKATVETVLQQLEPILTK